MRVSMLPESVASEYGELGMTRKRRMVKPPGYHSGPGFRRTLTVHGRQNPRTCARCGKKTVDAKHGFCPDCRRVLGRWLSESQTIVGLSCRRLRSTGI